MTVENAAVVDFIAHDPRTDVVSFVLFEYRDWGEKGELLLELQSKLETYLHFAQDGQFAAKYPHYATKALHFDLRTAYELGPMEQQFLEIVHRQHLAPRGIALSWRRHDADSGEAVGPEHVVGVAQ